MIETLKKACIEVRKSVKDLIGTEEGNTKMSLGAGGDISRKIDLIAEEKVIETIKQSGINPTIIGEECGTIKGNDGGYIIMDAIDGTTNVTRSIPFNCCSLAYATEPKLSSVVDAAIIDFATGDLYYASKDKGAFLNGNKISVRKADNIKEDEIIAGVNISGISQELLHSIGPVFSKLNHIRVFGANALELCFLARGYLDMFMDFRGKIRPTDMAAAYLIVKEAGGLILDKTGNTFDSELSFGNRFSFIALSDIRIYNLLAKDFKFQ
ncbi:MAG TPA: inositol monophosphatase family protein [Nitrososphaeraceae archaeon]|nr:inositol monophosphatase family protein [Nitrososphaeraceae archaeon]